LPMFPRRSPSPIMPGSLLPTPASSKLRGSDKNGLIVVGFWMMAWYICSMLTLFLNKTILSRPDGDEYVLGITQMLSTATYGGIKVFGPRLLAKIKSKRDLSKEDSTETQYSGADFYRNMVLVGVMRGATVILGLVSLSHVAVSFTETIKASAPIFTVVFARLMLGEKTSWQVNVALIPVMGGLMICSATELSFDMIGFGAVVANNVIDCVQNVFSKKLLLSGMTPVGLQFYTSLAAAVIQLPILVFKLMPHLLDKAAIPMSSEMMWMLFFDGIFYHTQSVTAYYTMSLLSPVSQSVANTAKRALLIILSILWFSNAVTVWNVTGVFIVVFGVFAYNYARMNFAATNSK